MNLIIKLTERIRFVKERNSEGEKSEPIGFALFH